MLVFFLETDAAPCFPDKPQPEEERLLKQGELIQQPVVIRPEQVGL